MHTTRSHTPESPRVRMVIPTSRPMKPDEGNAIFRLLALNLADDPEKAIEIPDPVSFRGNQTMFWPSISKGQDFWTDRNDAPILDVDAFLAAQPDWDNSENLPYQAEESKNGKIDPNRRMEEGRLQANFFMMMLFFGTIPDTATIVLIVVSLFLLLIEPMGCVWLGSLSSSWWG